MNPSENIILDSDALPYLLFSVGKNIYGISSEYVHSIETLGEVTEMSGSPPHVRGGVIYQGEFIYLVDMRRLFGLETQVDEFEKEVRPDQRIKDHEHWTTELEKSIQNQTEFTLTDDPHQCAFGRWFYSFKTENNVLKHQLNAIEAPHKAVHNTAKTIKRLMAENNTEEAMATIKELKSTHYKTTIHILSTLREIVEKSIKELYIVIDGHDCMKGIIIDTIVGVEYLTDSLEIPTSMSHPEFVQFLGKRKNHDKVVMVLNNFI